MPRPNPPPTPGSSSDLRGKEGANTAPAFNLPPTALQDHEVPSSTSTTPSANGSDSSYRPISPASPPELTRKRTASQTGSTITKDDFSLPPPPTRSRKIIQMKPKDTEQDGQSAPQATPSSQNGGGKTQNTSQSSGKKSRNTSNTTAAGRKIARKTAHSLIERRRRSKMNEEFGVLKDMIPACKGQEMHKLAILQASIDYLRYLERCVADLQTQHSSPKQAGVLPQSRMEDNEEEEDDEDEDEDEEMEDDDDEAQQQQGETTVSTPATAPQDRSASMISLPSLSQITTTTSTTTTTSPSAFSLGAGARHYSISSAASQASYSPYFHSNQTSPAFGPQLYPTSSYSTAKDHIGLGSPAIKPLDSQPYPSSRHIVDSSGSEVSEKRRRTDKELDREATAALLMLNTDRRNWRAGQQDGENGGTSRSNGGGMSVRDLLSG